MKIIKTLLFIACCTQFFAQTTIKIDQTDVNNGIYYYNNTPFSGVIVKIENNLLLEKYSVKEGKKNGQFIEYFFDARFKKENFKDTVLINSLSNSIKNLKSDIPKLINDTINSWNSFSNYFNQEIGGAKKLEKLNEKFNSQKLKGDQLNLWNNYVLLKNNHNKSNQVLKSAYAEMNKKEFDINTELKKQEYLPKIKLIGTYVNGLKEGNWQYYSIVSEKINREENYKSNKLNGLSKIYYDSGQIQEEASYVNDEKSGLVKIYFDNGKLSKQFTLENNLLSKTFIEYYINGNKKTESNYSNGKLNGQFKSYYDNGKIQTEGKYSNGLMTENWKYYFNNGNLMASGLFNNGLGSDLNTLGIPRDGREGKWMLYYENGKLEIQSSYKNGFLIETTKYHTNGKIKETGKGSNDVNCKSCYETLKRYNDDGTPWVSVWTAETDKYTNRTEIYTTYGYSKKLSLEYSKKSNRFVWRINDGPYIYGGIGMSRGQLPGSCMMYITIDGVRQEEYLDYGNPVFLPDYILEKLKKASEVAIKFAKDPTYYEFKLNGFEEAIDWLKNK